MTSPTVIDVNDSMLPTMVDDLSSTSVGTLVEVDKWGPGGVVGLSAPMSAAAVPFTLVERSGYTLTRLSLFGSVVALPELDISGSYGRIASVRYGPFVSQPAFSVLTIPASKVYLTSLGADGFLVYDFVTCELQLLTAGGARTVSRIPSGTGIQPDNYAAFTASSDGTAAAVSLAGSNYYARLAAPGVPVTDAVALPWSNGLVLTPTYLAGWWPDVSDVKVGRLRRDAIPGSGSAPDWEVLYADGSPGYEITSFAATDSGIAWITPGTAADNVCTLAMPAGAGTPAPVAYQRLLPNPPLSSCEGTGDFLLYDTAAPTPGLYRLAPGSAAGALVGTLGARWSMTCGLAVSQDRVAYSDDTTATYPVFLRDVQTPGQPGPQSQVAPVSSGTSPAISGPFIAVAGPASGSSADVTYGRIGSPLSTVTLPASDVVRIRLSGHWLLATGGTDSWLIDVLNGASPVSLGHVFAAVWGDELVTLNYDTALLQRSNLVSGATSTLRQAQAGCTSQCVDEELWCLAAWGTRTVFSFKYGGTTPGNAAGVHDTVTGVTVSLPTSPAGVYALDYSDDLLLAYLPSTEVHLYNLRTTPPGEALLDGYGERPVALDGYLAGWRPDSDLRAVVQDVRDAFPAYRLSEARYLNGLVPSSFAPASTPWQPQFYVTRDVGWTIDISSSSGLVRQLTGQSSQGEITPSWDGCDQAGVPVPAGSYTWTLAGTALDGKALCNWDGSSMVAASGTLLLDPIGGKRAESAMAFLGREVGARVSYPGGGQGQRYQHGWIYYSPATGAHEVHGAILARYLVIGGPGGLAGYPTSDETPVPKLASARMNTFALANLAIYWSGPTSAHEVHGAIRAYYCTHAGGPAGSLGLPITDEHPVAGGRQSRFQHGTLTWNATTGVVVRSRPTQLRQEIAQKT